MTNPNPASLKTSVAPAGLQALEPRQLLSGSACLLPLGDDAVYGIDSLNTAGFRGPLEDLTEQFGDNFGYAGTQDNLSGQDPFTGVTDRDHFGLVGATPGSLLTSLQNNNGGGGDAFTAMANAGESPDNVLVYVGANAINNGPAQPGNAATDLGSLMTYLRTKLTSSEEIYVAQLPPKANLFDSDPDDGRDQVKGIARYNFAGTNSINTIVAADADATAIDLFTIDAATLGTLTTAERAIVDVDGDTYVDWVLDYDESNPLGTTNLAGISGYNTDLLSDGKTLTSLGYKIIAEVVYAQLGVDGVTTGININPDVMITNIAANRLDTPGGRQLRATPGEFVKADGDDIWAGDAAIRTDGTARAAIREGIWANVTIQNTSGSSQNFDVNFVAYDPAIVGSTVYSESLTLAGNTTTTYVLPVHPDTASPAEGRWLGFFTVDGQPIDFNADLFIEVDSSELASSASDGIGTPVRIDFSGDTVPANQTSRVNAFDAVLDMFEVATGDTVPTYAHDILAAEAFSDERFAVTAASQIDLAVGAGAGEVDIDYQSLTINAVPGMGGTAFAPKFDTAAVLLKVDYAGAAPTFSGVPTNGGVLPAGSGVTWVIFSDLMLNSGFTPDTPVSETITITSTGTYTVTGYLAMGYGPFRGVPGMGNEAALIDYNGFDADPDSVGYLLVSGDQSTSVAITGSGTGGVEPVPVLDFNGDGNVDLVWRNQADGRNTIWYMDGEMRIGQKSIKTLANTDWELSGVADFNKDGALDLWFKNSVTGRNTVWFLDGNNDFVSSMIVAEAGPAWRVGGIGDFNSDGNKDVFWERSTGERSIWYLGGMDGVSQIGTATPDGLNPAVFTVTGITDFDDDGDPDVLYRRLNSNISRVALMDNATQTGTANLPNRGSLFHLAAAGDYNDDGELDFVWRRPSANRNQVWLGEGTGDGSDIGDYDVRNMPNVGPDWQLPGTSLWYD